MPSLLSLSHSLCPSSTLAEPLASGVPLRLRVPWCVCRLHPVIAWPSLPQSLPPLPEQSPTCTRRVLGSPCHPMAFDPGIRHVLCPHSLRIRQRIAQLAIPQPVAVPGSGCGLLPWLASGEDGSSSCWPRRPAAASCTFFPAAPPPTPWPLSFPPPDCRCCCVQGRGTLSASTRTSRSAP